MVGLARLEARALSKKERRSLLERLKPYYTRIPFSEKADLRLVKARTDSGEYEIITVDGVPCLFEWSDGRIYPTLQCLKAFGVDWLKGVVLVDKGAAIALAKGAHLMIPGVVGVEGSFTRGDVVAALYHETRTPVMVGVAEVDSSALEKLYREKARGRAVRRVHRLGDALWELAQEVGKRLS